jgi:signal transduction histidine kinase
VRGGGRVRVEVRTPGGDELPGGLSFPHGAVALHVSDDGAGIPPDALDRLFDPFFTTRKEGSGLGLAVVQRAVEAHRGVVLVDAGGDGAGAHFTMLLPRAAGAEPELPEARPYMPTPPSAQRAVA